MDPTQAQQIPGTITTIETPYTPTAPSAYEYPFPDQRNASLYQLYRARASALPNTLICGRLGEYRYYDMDQAIERAMTLAEGILNGAERIAQTA
jgi:UDP-galactopyranose mutase